MSIFTDRMLREAKTIKSMVRIYCSHHHGKTVSDCAECLEIQNYALDRLDYCPFQAGKTSCKKCPVHCYKPSMKDEIKRVMRFSGPRMLLRHPVLTVFHLLDDRQEEPIITPSSIKVNGYQKKSKHSGNTVEDCEHLSEDVKP